MSSCKCAIGSKNTGSTGQEYEFHAVVDLLVSQRVADDGSDNVIDLSTIVDGITTQQIVDLQNQSDPSKRWYHIAKAVNGEFNVGDPIDETLSDGSIVNVDVNPYLLTAEIFKRTPQQTANMNRLACSDIQAIMLDRCGSGLGEIVPDDTTKFRGILLNKDSWLAQFAPANPTTAMKTTLRVQSDKLSRIDNWRFLPSKNLNVSEIRRGVQDALVTNVTSATTTELVFDLGFPVGNALENSPLVGLASTDLELVNVTADTVVPLAGLTESATVKGRYTATFAAQTAADVVYLKSADTAGVFNKTGFEVQENRQTLA